MKKLLSLTLGAFALSLSAFSQTFDPRFGGGTGKYLIDVYTGYSIANDFLDNTPSGASNLKTRNIGTSGVRLQAMVSPHNSIGLDINFSEIYTSYRLEVPNLNYMKERQRIRIQARAEYHFKAEPQKASFDPYMGVAIGYKNTTRRYETNDPTWQPFTQKNDLSHLGLRACMGLRYYVTDQIGANVELGMGGAFLQGGLSAKF